MIMLIHGEEVHGIGVDSETRCTHWHSPLDIIAIKFKCCGTWYSCFDCHQELAKHRAAVWLTDEFDERVILCGSCGRQFTVHEYLSCNSVCLNCESPFNPGCSRHHHLYFRS
jgi:uncharacterized CHY-type Zn-finger protein